MKLTKYFVILVGLVSMLGSCTLEKKQYSAGYHVEWKFLNNGKGEVQPAWQRSNTKPVQAGVAENSVALQVQNDEEYMVATEFQTEAQPEVITIEAAKTGKPMAAKHMARILRKAEKAAGNFQQVSFSDVSEGPTFSSTVGENPSPVNDGPGEVQWKAALIAFFFGFMGLHRFYLGYTTIGWIQVGLLVLGMGLYAVGIATLATTSTITLPILSIIGIGVLGILYTWVFWDFIRILFGRLQPNGDSYRKAFYK